MIRGKIAEFVQGLDLVLVDQADDFALSGRGQGIEPELQAETFGYVGPMYDVAENSLKRKRPFQSRVDEQTGV